MGEPLIGPWKQEFQRRGAPHFHLSTTPPMGFTMITDPDTGQDREVDFRTWLSLTWAEIVDHPDPEQRRRHRAAGTGVDYAEASSSPTRAGWRSTSPSTAPAVARIISTGFPDEWITSRLVCEDCGAEYDDDRDECPDCGCLDAELVDTAAGPAGSGATARGLRPILAPRQVSPVVGIQAGRVLRRWYRAQGLTKQVTVDRVDRATGRVYTRRSRRRRWLFAHNRGFACVNDGPAVASQLARYLNCLVESVSPAAQTTSDRERRRGGLGRLSGGALHRGPAAASGSPPGAP